MFLAVLRTHYEIYAIGSTKAESEKNLLKGYKESFPKEDRTIKSPKSAQELFDYFGGGVHEIKNGYVSE